MPDTGAPWNIPYVTSTDLVSDWPTDSLALANAIDAGLDAAYVGIGTNVVQTVKTDTFTTTSTSYTDITNFDVTITPSSATAKVLIICQFYAGNASLNQYTSWTLLRGATAIYQGDAAGNRNRATGSSLTVSDTGFIAAQIACFLDSPASASPVTYKAQMRVTGGTGVFNRTGADTDTVNFSRTPASFTAIEVAA